MYTLGSYIESRRRVSNLKHAFETSLATLTAEQRAELTKALEDLTASSPEEFAEAFIGWLTEEKEEEHAAKRIKKTAKTSGS